jgi:DNA helicase-2/ATP-dependent DNA helicase PcrA
MANEPYRVYKLKRAAVRSSRIDYDRELNAAQREVVFAPDGPLLVIAGAGTGKTRTLTYRVARLLEAGASPHEIVLLTFTRRAAHEMLSRVEALVGQDCREVLGGTYHAFCSAMLRRFPPEGYPNHFTILDRGDAEDTIQLVRGERGLRRGERRFPRKATLAEIFSRAVNTGAPVAEVLAADYEQFLGHREAIEEIAKGYAAYKRRHALLDYDDLLVFLAEKLREDRRARDELQARSRYVLVDEYQDTNALQAEITDRLAGRHRNLMVVGDDSQSIYAFRGADYRNILHFPERYPDARVIKLERNYRSTQSILDVTNAVIAAATIGFPKRLQAERGAGEKPAIVMARGEGDQASFIAQRVVELREEGVPLDHVAVLFRSAFLSYPLEMELTRRDIPFVKYGGFRFLEAAHIKDVLAHLRVVDNPRDAVSWNRLLGLIDGVGPTRARQIFESNLATPDPLELEELPAQPRIRERLADLRGLFARLRDERVRPAERVGQVLEYYDPILKDRYDDHPRRLRDLEHFRVLCEGYANLQSMLSDMSLDPPDRSVEDRLAVPLDERERLVLSTIHSAKGMEWKVVFLLGALDGQFPSSWAVRDHEELEEERRLMYVATTRAKDLLYVSYPVGVYHPVSGRILTKPSRFLDDVPDALWERWAVTE